MYTILFAMQWLKYVLDKDYKYKQGYIYLQAW